MPKTTNNSRFARFKVYIPGAFYHIYNRGNGKSNIFNQSSDYSFYLNRLSKYKDKYQVNLLCFCLMPNHIHLLAQQTTELPIYKLISSLHTSYSMYFNKKYQHTGHIFQDRFKQAVIETDEYLLHLSRYIHLNPAAAGLVQDPLDYKWSSLSSYLGFSQNIRLNTNQILSYFGSKEKKSSQSYKDFIYDHDSSKSLDILENLVLEAS